MKKTLIVMLLMLSATGYSVSSDPLSPRVAESRGVCWDNNVREQCQETCAMVCAEDKDFRDRNWGYCISILPPNSPRDDATCPSMVANAVRNLSENPCAQVTELFAQLECEKDVLKKANKYPQCAPNVWTLIDDAASLEGSIGSALEKYTEILALNLDTVQDRDALCGYSRDDLSRHYAQATREGQEFVLLQNKAKGIEGCAGEFEKWLKSVSMKDAGDISDNLDDNLIRDTSEQLKKLEPQRRKLFESVDKLKAVGPTIRALGIRHIQFCRNKRREVARENKLE